MPDTRIRYSQVPCLPAIRPGTLHLAGRVLLSHIWVENGGTGKPPVQRVLRRKSEVRHPAGQNPKPRNGLGQGFLPLSMADLWGPRKKKDRI